ncbi:nucleotide excision repair endonuclease [Bacillus sp. Bva_UNVM-123]|uniref:nucleotide excision repair endonuclease n=1 Tax=Bacillus sp. Bva_UNVM-123 TaxID=2829798 RepID=UPI00391F021D
MIKIEIPDCITITCENINMLSPSDSGVYCFYSNDDKLLYIGKASELKQRLQTHFSGGSKDNNTSRFNYLIDYAKVFFENCPLKREIYETYMINKMKPLYNKQKCILYKSKYYQLPRYPNKQNKLRNSKNKNRCVAMTMQGEQCKCNVVQGTTKCRIHTKIN